jgi:hypothetical protein
MLNTCMYAKISGFAKKSIRKTTQGVEIIDKWDFLPKVFMFFS